jgi:hypothetical protein
MRIYTIPITTHDIWVNEFDSKTTHLNPDSNITIFFLINY